MKIFPSWFEFRFVCLSPGYVSGGQSPAMKKLEQFSVQKVTGDGRCMFRALVLSSLPFVLITSLVSPLQNSHADLICYSSIFEVFLFLTFEIF